MATTDSVDRLLAIDNDQLTRASFVNTLLPLLSGIVGLILLVVGILVGRGRAKTSRPPPAPARRN